jgi:polar amino acid transport system substrate-binding protein
LYFDILRAVYEPAGYKVQTAIMPYATAVKKVQDKTADIVVGPYADEVEGVIYPKWHFSADDVTALILKDQEAAWKGEKGLTGKKVAWIRGYDFDQYLDAKMVSTLVDKRENAINLLTKKRIDVFLDNQYDIAATLEEMKLDPAQFSTKLVKYLDLFMCFPKSAKGKELAAIWDPAFEKLVRKGTIKSLFEKWDMMGIYNFK